MSIVCCIFAPALVNSRPTSTPLKISINQYVLYFLLIQCPFMAICLLIFSHFITKRQLRQVFPKVILYKWNNKVEKRLKRSKKLIMECCKKERNAFKVVISYCLSHKNLPQKSSQGVQGQNRIFWSSRKVAKRLQKTRENKKYRKNFLCEYIL